MKSTLLNPVKIGLLIASFMLVSGISYGVTYTAVASGNWSNAATWGGTAPPYTLGIGDQVNIGTGINVTMDGNVTVNGLLAQISVTGTLSAMPYMELDVISGTVTGTGSINVPEVILTSTGAFTFTGSLTADTLVNSMVGLNSSAQLVVNDELTLSSVINIAASGLLQMGTNSNITISGGGITLTGGTLNLTAHYNVNYVSSSATSGMELSGSGLGDVTLNVSAANNVTLGSNITMNDSLKFISGTLVLNGYNLTANGEISGNIMIAGNAASNVTINTSGGLASALMFTSGGQSLNNLTVNVGADSVKISSPLTVDDMLTINGSGNLDVRNHALTVAGNVSGSGSIVANNKTELSFTGSTSVTGNIHITGTDVGKLTVNLGSNNNSVTLGSNLSVDTLNLINGSLMLNSHNLSLYGDISSGGSGVIASTSSSNITVNTGASTTGTLNFSASNDSINNLNLNIGGSGSLKLGSDLVILGTLNFTNGYVDIQNNMLNMGAAATVTGARSNAYIITSGSNSSVTMYASVSNTTTFQVGTASNYLPAAITLNSGSSTGTIGLNVSSGVYSQGTTGAVISASQPMVDATWLFQNNIGSGLNANMQLSWSASAEVNGFIHTGDYISHYESSWDDITADSMTAMLSGGMYSVTRANVTSMSPFAVFDQNTVPTGINEVSVTNGDIIVYPNPTRQNLYIKNSTGYQGLVYGEIYNTIGQLVSSFQFKDDVASVPVSDLATGTYLVRFYNDNMEVVKKFNKL